MTRQSVVWNLRAGPYKSKDPHIAGLRMIPGLAGNRFGFAGFERKRAQI